MDEDFKIRRAWHYRGEDRRYWHAWVDGVHIWWRAVVDDFGNLVLIHNF